jgi:hypothetical protein
MVSEEGNTGPSSEWGEDFGNGKSTVHLSPVQIKEIAEEVGKILEAPLQFIAREVVSQKQTQSKCSLASDVAISKHFFFQPCICIFLFLGCKLDCSTVSKIMWRRLAVEAK